LTDLGTPNAAGDGSVTVVVPLYNGERFIRRALDGVLRQTRPATQIVVVDDASPDGSREIVAREYGDRVTLISKQNEGAAQARNTGLKAATGEFIAFLDQDDFWEPTKLEVQVPVLQTRPELVGTYTGLRVISEQGEHLSDMLPVPPATLVRSLRWCNPGLPPSSALLRRSAVERVGGFAAHLTGTEDWNLWCKLVRVGPFATTPEPLTFYQSSTIGVSGDPDLVFTGFLQILDEDLLSDLSGLQRSLWRRRIISYQAYKSSLTARAAGQKTKEWEYMKKSFLTWPSPFWAPERFKSFAVTVMRS